jgi:serine/threonine protein kinase
MTEDWTKWESLVINGVFPLGRFLGKSDHGVVFLTEDRSQHPPTNAAIKLLPADPKLAQEQLALWRAAAALSHPHLIRLFESGRCQLGGQEFLFVVMEHAEETLAQILPHRALTADEVRGLLLPTLDALAFLHRQNLVHSQLKPPNILVVKDQLKLASDNIHPAGRHTRRIAEPTVYEPPEAMEGTLSAAGDIWGLGVVIVEALTQSLPRMPDRGSQAVSLPATLPGAYVDIVRRCLSHNRAARPTIGELEAQIKVAQQAAALPLPSAAPRDVPAAAPPARRSPSGRWIAAGAAGSIALVLLIWAGLHSFHGHPDALQSAAGAPRADQSSLQQADPPVIATPNPKPSRSVPSSVLHQEIPNVPRGARESIRGHIKVSVRVTVDGAGNVAGATLENHGSSKYFAGLAVDAARKWKFSPADEASRAWLLLFEFSRGGTAGHAVASRS